MTTTECKKLEEITDEIYKRGYNDGLARGVEIAFKRGYEKGQRSAQIPIVNIKGETYCRFEDVQKLWNEMKGEGE